MILNVSSRTDVVAFYSKWFLNRLNEGYFDVRNPFYPKNISRIMVSDIDLIFFITKNPIPIIKDLDKIKIPYMFHITLTPYHKDIEPNVKKDNIINSIKEISKKIGKNKIILRYDPILKNHKYTIDYHIKAFNKICSLLDGYIEKIIISFVDDYKNTQNNMEILQLEKLTQEDYEKIWLNFSNIANKHNIIVQTCNEEINLFEYGFNVSECISNLDVNKIIRGNYKKSKSRKSNFCKCIETVDIGCYNTCLHLCKYCYANYNEKDVKINIKKHNVNSSLLIGELEINDVIKVRKD